MNVKKIGLTLSAVSAVGILFAACSAPTAPEGMWKAENGSAYEFVDAGYVESANGTVTGKGAIAVDGSTIFLYPEGFDHTAGETDKTLTFADGALSGDGVTYVQE